MTTLIVVLITIVAICLAIYWLGKVALKLLLTILEGVADAID